MHKVRLLDDGPMRNTRANNGKQRHPAQRSEDMLNQR